MDSQKITAAIARMRDRNTLREIMDACEARDSVLSNLESERRSKIVFGRFETLKKGDGVYMHADPLNKSVHSKYRWLHGQPLTVLAVKPRNKEIEVMATHPGGRSRQKVKLTWSILDRLKVSTQPTPEALAYVLKGDE